MYRIALFSLLGMACATPGPSSVGAQGVEEPGARAASSTTERPDPATARPAAADADEGDDGDDHDELAQPIPQKINARYQEESNADRWAKRFENEGREAFDNRDAIVKLLALAPDMSVADIGTGSGLFAMAFAEQVPSGTVFAVDVQEYFLDHVRERAAAAGVANMTFVKAGQRSAGLAPSSVDVAFMCDVFHHVEYPRHYLATLFDAVRPGGRLVVIDYIAKEGVSEAWVLEHVRATPEAFRAEFEQAGFVFSVEHDLLKENFLYVFTRPRQ